MHNLDDIRTFARAAQLGSFSAAARSLQLPVSTVSRKVAMLEARLGLSRSHFEGPLHVSAPLALGRGEFVGFVSDFLRRHPRIRVNLVITNQFVDLVTSHVDVAIRFGELADSSVVARRLGLSYRVLVATPGYLKSKGLPRTPQDLRNHDCVLFASKAEETEWQLQEGRHRARVRVSGAVAGDNFETVNELALHGHGIALLPESYAVAGTASGALKRIMPQWTSPPIPVHVVYVNRRFVPAKLQTFINELAAWKNSSWGTAAG